MSNVVQSALLVNEMERPKSTQGVFDLPCGFLDEEGTLHTEVELSEMGGNEEDLLISTATPNQKKMSLLIGRCVRRIGSITDRGKIAMIADRLTVGDRTFILFALRRVALGDAYPFKATCHSCRKEDMYMVDMSELEVRPMKDPHKRIFDGQLPSGKMMRFRVMTGEDEAKLGKVKLIEDKLSMSMLLRMELLDGKPPTLDDIKRMSLRDRDAARALFEENDGGVDTTLDMQCRQCGAEFQDEVDPGQPGFFFPSTTQRRSRARSSS